MRAFHTIAIPHRDILEGKLTMEVFAADLWGVYNGEGPDDYKDPETFFRKTYMTQALKNLLNIIERRLLREGGDPVIQLQTPFGGGKTHALIAMYHKAREWKTNPVVIVGEKLNTGDTAEKFDTLWGVMEEQLTGSKKNFVSPVPPGGEQIKKLLSDHLPVLILMDELVPYLNVADAVKVGNKTLTALTLTFLHNLTNVVSEMAGVSLVFTTTPSNPYDKSPRGEEIVAQLQNITGRREIIKSPIQENEVTQIIRRRLFSSFDEDGAREVVTEFMEYAEREGILPAGILPSQYRDRFLDSYPFMPEVVDVLYHRWGSFPMFQRARGVLRLLSLVVYSLKDTDKPYISLADFDLANQEIRQELLKHIGPEYNSVIAADITDVNSGAKKVDVSLGSAYRGLKLGTRSATTIFLYSFSGGHERGATLGEIKRSATTLHNPASVVVEAFEQLKNKLSYLWSTDTDGKYFFSSQPNINRLLLNNMENVKEDEIVEVEQELLKDSIKGAKLKTFVWKENAGDIPDSEELKLVVLRRKDEAVMENIKARKGISPRSYPNTIFFLYPMESERPSFVELVKRKIAYELIEQDRTLTLSDDQRRDIKKKLGKVESDLKEHIRRLYRLVAVPIREGFKDLDLGVPTYGEEKGIDEEVYDRLQSDGEILKKIAPLVIKEKYLSDREYVSTRQIYQSSIQTPGEPRPISKEVLAEGFAEGVNMGLFGLGELEGDKPVCRYFKEHVPASSFSFSSNEVLINESICSKQKEEKVPEEILETRIKFVDRERRPGVHEKEEQEEFRPRLGEVRSEIKLRFQVPKGKVSDIMGMMNFLQSKFDSLEIELIAREGEISEQEYEDKIEETLRQLGIELS